MNYQSELEKILAKDSEQGKKVLLHSCCAPCSSYVLTYLRQYFRVTVFYFNPNITADTEYYKRVDEVKRLIVEMGLEDVDVIAEDYNVKIFLDILTESPEQLRNRLRRLHNRFPMQNAPRKTGAQG